MLKRVYSRSRYMGRKGESEKCRGIDQRVQKRVWGRDQRSQATEIGEGRKGIQLGTTKRIYSQTGIWMGEKRHEEKREEMGRKLEAMEKFLGTRNLEEKVIF